MRQWRVGTISMGFLLIALGVLLLGNTLWDIAISDIIVYGWPVILILLGVEVLLFSFFKKETHLKFDFFSVFILILAVIFTFVIYTVQETGIYSSIRNVINGKGYTLDVNRTLEIPDSIEEIIIDIQNGEINISGEDTNTAEITGTIRLDAENKDEAEGYLEKVFTVKIIGEQAIIRVEEVNNFKWFGNNPLKANLSITLPKDIMINTKLINGDINIRDMINSGKIDGVNGEVVLEDSKGNYDINTVNGKIDLKNINGNVSVKTVNGEMSLKEVLGKLTATTTNGEIDISASKVEGDWDIETLNGEISVDILKDINAKISAKASIGEVNGNIPWVSKDGNNEIKVGEEKEAVFGEGKYTIEINTKSGEITVNTK